ncbi:TPA: DUF4754 family protein [Escherichia coli]
MDKEYKTLINKALEQYWYDVEHYGPGAASLASETFKAAVRQLRRYAGITRDYEAYHELDKMFALIERGVVVAPYELEVSA